MTRLHTNATTQNKLFVYSARVIFEELARSHSVRFAANFVAEFESIIATLSAANSDISKYHFATHDHL